MIDWHVRDDWPEDEPVWVKSLVSSMYRREGSVDVLPLNISVQEILDWVALARADSWWNVENRLSLIADLEQAMDALRPITTAYLAVEVKAFRDAVTNLNCSGKGVLSKLPEARTDVVWRAVATAGETLLDRLATDAAADACWSDLVAVARATKLERREYRAVADLLFEQVRVRHADSARRFSDAVHALAGDAEPEHLRGTSSLGTPEDRLARAREILLAPATVVPVVVWLGYRSGRVNHSVSAGPVTFMEAQWFVPNAHPGREEIVFEFKDELAKIVKLPVFKVPEHVDEANDVDVLARVDLGVTWPAGAAVRAESIVDALINPSIHWSRGVLPVLVQSAVVCDGEVAGLSFGSGAPAPFVDHWGLNITADALDQFAPELGAAVAKRPLPKYLEAAVEAQTAADRPTSRETMFERDRHADVFRGVLALEDRVVEHAASYASVPPRHLTTGLMARWPHNQWEIDVDRATRICLLGGGAESQRVEVLQRKFYDQSPNRPPWLVLVADNEPELVDLCRVESERAWVRRMIRSVSDPSIYAELRGEYEPLAEVLRRRHRRVRNAVVHGNPVQGSIASGVVALSSYLSGYALRVGLDSFITDRPIPEILDREMSWIRPLLAGVSAADHWRAPTDGA